MNSCRVCRNNHGNKTQVFTERYLGAGDKFGYIECSICSSLSITAIPDDMSRYYPGSYYSYTAKNYSRLQGYLKGCRDRFYLGGYSTFGRLVSNFSAAPAYIEWLKNLGLRNGASILDVGCGAGTLVVNLKDAGFKASGIDPFIAQSLYYANGAYVLKQSLVETSGSFDCIMMHHCLEHMAEPHEAFRHLSRLLKPEGKLLIRVPLTGTYAWRTYGEHWFQLDAPRHAVLFTQASLCGLAEKHGFMVDKIDYDSTASQFWGSEEYIHNIAHSGSKSYAVNPACSIFSAAEIKEFTEKASELNRCKDGDQAAFYFSRADRDE